NSRFWGLRVPCSRTLKSRHLYSPIAALRSTKKKFEQIKKPLLKKQGLLTQTNKHKNYFFGYRKYNGFFLTFAIICVPFCPRKNAESDAIQIFF
ncbi:MAG: hypothetical protein SH848_17370, partial [Saprospiraceae bacterium]|nr:hypothetical protein [Saprospiraceae bacterium]MDZ4705701.1 hypothetical protein [Saprospiraceae bacterium]